MNSTIKTHVDAIKTEIIYDNTLNTEAEIIGIIEEISSYLKEDILDMEDDIALRPVGDEWEPNGKHKKIPGLWKDKNNVIWYNSAINFLWGDEEISDLIEVEGITRKQKVVLPFKPKTFDIKVRAEDYDPHNPNHIGKKVEELPEVDYDPMIFFIDDRSQLINVIKYYNLKE
jgi:hypothetical protein